MSASVRAQVGARIREAREAAKMTQAQLGAAAGVTRSMIEHLERGRADTTVTRLVAIAAALGLEPGVLLGDSASAA